MKCFGIDFGTTNSCAVNLPGDPTNLFGDDEGRPLPSIVIIDKATGEAHCGRDAWRQRLEFSEMGGYHVITSVKQILDQDRNWHTRPQRWDVPQVAAAVLTQLSKRSEILGIKGGIEKATFGIPIGMSPHARRNLRKAAQIAGIKVNGFVKESTAVLMRYWDSIQHCRYVGVFDWGGGTLDISVIEIRGGALYELQTLGMKMAGDFLDDRIARFVHAKIMNERGLTASFEDMSPEDRDKMLFHCETAKCELRSTPESMIALARYGDRPASYNLTRDICRPIIEKPVKEAIELLAACVHQSGISIDELDQAIVVGGSSKLWLLSELLGGDPRFLGKCEFTLNPEWDVAHGAAILEAKPGRFALNENIGLELSDGTNYMMVPRGSAPTVKPLDISLSLVEDAKQANILVNHFQEPSSARGLIQMAVPAMGFDQEDILLKYRLTDDLTFHISGQSSSRDPNTAVERETEELLFSYKLE